MSLLLDAEQRALWERVAELWALSKGRDEARIRAALHPRYCGWDMSAERPHDRDGAVRSVTGDAPTLTDYELHPLSVQVYEGMVGVVHYSYSATVVPGDASAQRIHGRWCEVYLKEGPAWTMVSVSGLPLPDKGR